MNESKYHLKCIVYQWGPRSLLAAGQSRPSVDGAGSSINTLSFLGVLSEPPLPQIWIIIILG